MPIAYCIVQIEVTLVEVNISVDRSAMIPILLHHLVLVQVQLMMSRQKYDIWQNDEQYIKNQ